MKVHGVEISDETIKWALNDIVNSFSAYELERSLIQADVPRTSGLNYISITAASRIIAMLKKQNKIKKVYGGGGNTIWQFKTKNRI